MRIASAPQLEEKGRRSAEAIENFMVYARFFKSEPPPDWLLEMEYFEIQDLLEYSQMGSRWW